MQKNAQSRKVNLPEVIADKVREMVIQGVLSPGVQLRQMELAKQFGTSRVPLREAFKRLTVEGVIEHDQNRGFFVAKFSYDEACQLYRIRYLLEIELLKSIQWPNKTQLSALAKKMGQLNTYLQEQDSVGWLEIHRDFYEIIFNLSPQKILIREVFRLMRLTDRYRSLAPYSRLSKECLPAQEERLLNALKAQDREQLINVFKEERSNIEKDLLKELKLRGL